MAGRTHCISNEDTRPRRLIAASLITLLLLIFIVDLMVPWGYAVPILYLLPLILTLWLPSAVTPLALAGLCTALLTVGFLQSPSGGVVPLGLFNRVSGVLTIWGSWLLLHRHRTVIDQLRTERQRYRTFIDTVPATVSEVSPSGICTFTNTAPSQPGQHGPAHEPGKPFFEGLHADDRQRALEAYRVAVSFRRSLTLEYRVRRADGEYRWVLANGSPDLLLDGTLNGYVVAAIDITDRKEAEEALARMRDELEQCVMDRTAQLRGIITELQAQRVERQLAEGKLQTSEKQFQSFMNHLPGFAWIKDAGGAYVYANRYFLEAFGLKAAELLGRTDAELFPPEVASQFIRNDERVRQQDHNVEVVEALPVRKAVRYGLARKFPIRNDRTNETVIAGLSFDVTERKQTEDALRESEQRLAAILESALDAVIGMDGQGMVTSWNKRAELIFGWTRSEAIGQVLAQLIIPPALRRAHESGLTAECMKTRGAF